jgi:hypothetical protein
MTEGNRLFMDAIRKMGFGWFEKAGEPRIKNEGEK